MCSHFCRAWKAVGTEDNPGGHQCWQSSCCLLVSHWQMEGDTLRLIGPYEKMALKHKGNEGNKGKMRSDWFLLLNLLLASIFSCTDDVIVIKVSSHMLACELSLEALTSCLCSAALMFSPPLETFDLPQTMKYTNEQIGFLWFQLLHVNRQQQHAGDSIQIFFNYVKI